jgi:hypothetical protein
MRLTANEMLTHPWFSMKFDSWEEGNMIIGAKPCIEYSIRFTKLTFIIHVQASGSESIAIVFDEWIAAHVA